MHSSSHGFQSKIGTLAFVLMLVTLWLLLRGYHGLIGDAQIYAFQALARIFPQFASDLYLQNSSQDQFSIFSPIYAWFIEIFGLEPAARLLTLLFTVWFLAAAWSAARTLAGSDAARLAVAFLLIIPGSYGGSGVFQIADQFLTARLPAEALIVTSLACFLRGRKELALVIATLTLIVHPLIALPGLLLLLCLWLPLRVSISAAIAGILAALAAATAATRFPWISQLLPIMDSPWLTVVQERSQFLFLQLWSFRDWDLNIRPFFYLAFIGLAIQDDSIRKLCVAAATVGAAGLMLAFIAGAIGPLAILVQGQAWRWIWVAVFVSALLLPAVVLGICDDKRCGPLCALLLVSGWTLSAVDGTACVSLAMILWIMRARIGARLAEWLRSLAAALAIAIVAWILVHSWEIVVAAARAPTSTTPTMPSIIQQIQDIFGMRIPAALGVAAIWWHMRAARALKATVLLTVALLAASMLLLPAAFKQSRVFGDAAGVAEFSDWQSIIPPTSTVLVVPTRDVGSFVWFTLQRPNYSAVDQSAGVVFSRATALEVQRRSHVLLPIMAPNWKIMTQLRESAWTERRTDDATRALTEVSLKQICTDPKLGFVVSAQSMGFNALRHEHAGAWKNWSLYDCRKVRLARPET
jgi:hypothetical protein